MPSTQRFSLTLGVAVLALGFFSGASSAFACSCASSTPDEQLSNATAVFVGTVKNISEDGGKKNVEFDVSESKKGSVGDTVTVTTAGNEAACGMDFEKNKTYVVYAYGDGELSTGLCQGTAEIGVDAVDVPEEETPEPIDQKSSPVPYIIVAIVAFSTGALFKRLVK